MARNFYLKKGESTLIRIQTEGSYTIGFTTIPELELGQTTSCLYKTGDSERCFRFTAPADGVYLFTAAGESYAAVYISDGSVTRWERRGRTAVRIACSSGNGTQEGTDRLLSAFNT